MKSGHLFSFCFLNRFCAVRKNSLRYVKHNLLESLELLNLFSGKIALVVEDQQIIARDYENFLTQRGFDVVIFSTGSETINFLRKQTPSLVIIDINLADGISGFEIAKILKQKYVPFIFASSFEDQKNLEIAASLKPLGIFTKPFLLERLEPIIQKLPVL
jgi:DNA-binding response OmpR family regulator